MGSSESTAALSSARTCILMHVLALDSAAVDSLEPIQTAQQSRLAAARRADDPEHGLGRDFERDAAQNARAVRLLAQICDTNHGLSISLRLTEIIPVRSRRSQQHVFSAACVQAGAPNAPSANSSPDKKPTRLFPKAGIDPTRLPARDTRSPVPKPKSRMPPKYL